MKVIDINNLIIISLITTQLTTIKSFAALP